MNTNPVKAYGTAAAENPLVPMKIDRRDVLAKDIEIERKQIANARLAIQF